MDIKEILEKHFPNFEKELVDEITKEGKIVSFPANELMMDFGSPIEMIPLIYKGNVKVYREDEEGNELFLYFLESSDACALSLVCSGRDKISRVRAVAIEDTQAVAIPLYKMDEWMQKYRTWYQYVLETYQFRMEELLKTIDTIAFKRMDDRLIEYLRKTSEAHNSLVLNETHQNIAQELNSSREVISRLLKKLEQKGMIKLSRNQIEIIDLFI